MRRRTCGFVVVLAVLFGVDGASPPAAEAAPCPESGSYTLFPDHELGGSLSFGRRLSPEAVQIFIGGWQQTSATLSFAPAATGAISHPFSYELPASDFTSGFNYSGPLVLFEPGDGPGRVQINWTAQNGATTCDGTTGYVISPAEGISALASTKVVYGYDQKFKVTVRCPNAPSLLNIGLSSTQPIRVRVSGGGPAKSFELADSCDGTWNRKKAASKRWAVGTSGIGDDIPEFDWGGGQWHATIRSRNDLPASVRVQVIQGSRVLQRKRFVFHTIIRRQRIYFEGSDAFVNYCINTGQEIRSRGGRLYCVRPAVNRTVISKIR